MEILIQDIIGQGMGPAFRLGVALGVAGLLALYIGFLYNRCSLSLSSPRSLSSVFPMLTIVTAAVIMVVKSSLALSLGLVGALSIVRFRAAIKSPEELTYLFLCIAVGLALGAEHHLCAMVLVFVASVFIVGARFLARGTRRCNLLLTVTGEAEYFTDPSYGVLAAVEELTDSFSIQRFEVDDDQGMLRIVVNKSAPDETVNLIAGLRRQLQGCNISYVNLDATL